MSKDNAIHSHRITRYNLTIAFEELYTQDDTQLRTSANAIDDVARVIEQLITTDIALQELLKTQNLKLSIISPARRSTRQGAGGSRGRGPRLSNGQTE